MSCRRFYVYICYALLFFSLAACSEEKNVSLTSTISEHPKPNILLILLDDFGVNDLGINNNHKSKTPNLNDIAAKGSYFPRHYTDSTCAPSRAALLTGLRPTKLGFAPTGVGISPEIITLPELLKNNGYQTEHIGKWHLGHRDRLAWPDKQGFDTWFGFLHQFNLSGPHAPDDKGFHQPRYNNPWLQENNKPSREFKGHLNDILTEKTIHSISQNPSQPWFINLWYFAPHTPIQPSKEFLKDHTPEGRYLALLEQLDNNIGKIIKRLKETNQLENTVIIVTSDNGGTNRHFPNNQPFLGGKGQYQEGGIRTPLFILSKNKVPVTTNATSLLDIYPTIAELAGIKPTNELHGRSLFNPTPKEILWVLEHPFGTLFSWLNPKGDRRFDNQHNYFYLDSSSTPEIVDIDFKKQFFSPALKPFWETLKEDRIIKLDIENLENSDYLNFKGDPYRRVSAYNGLSISFALSPDILTNSVIAEQPGHWNINLKNKRIVVTAYGQELHSLPLNTHQCQTATVSFYLGRSDLRPDLEKGWVKLFVDKKEQQHINLISPSLTDKDLHAATKFIKPEKFNGKISLPFFYKKGLEINKPVENLNFIPDLCSTL